MSARRIFTLWRRARRAGRDLDYVSYLAGIVGGTVFLAISTGMLGPSLDARTASPTPAPATYYVHATH